MMQAFWGRILLTRCRQSCNSRLRKRLLVSSERFGIHTSHRFGYHRLEDSRLEAMCARESLVRKLLVDLGVSAYLVDDKMYVFGGGPRKIGIILTGAIVSYWMWRCDNLNIETSREWLKMRYNQLLISGRSLNDERLASNEDLLSVSWELTIRR